MPLFFFPTPVTEKNRDIPVPITHPAGQDIQIPAAPKGTDSTNARTTLKTRSVKVAIINAFILPEPLRTPSAMSLKEIIM